ncbi:MAG: DUF4445 domain-containing protein, partial [Clostridia bacterium]|nr:DUF4445 domain-containing protein [Clostridia bacterium]
FLLDGKTGEELANASMLNPQSPYGADVISRIQAALSGDAGTLQELITNAVGSLIGTVCEKSGSSPEDIGVVSVVGNPAMQQLFLGIDVSNLAGVPFDPVLTEPGVLSASDYLPVCPNADLLVVPDIAGYVGADTMACVLSCALEKSEEPTLLVDIGTNGEMVLSAGGRMAACSTAAGPALEGAKIRFGMRGAKGAIDKVRWEDGDVRCHVIGDCSAEGICGSGLIDAVAVYLEQGLINKRGRIQTKDEIDGERTLPLTDGLYLTQTDIREVMLAKGAVAAGIELMARYLGLELTDIKRVLLAGAFGSFLDPNNACRMGLLPEELQGRITAVGNAAGSGAKLIARSKDAFAHTGELKGHIEAIELANLDDFMHTFAKTMNFREVRHD